MDSRQKDERIDEMMDVQYKNNISTHTYLRLHISYLVLLYHIFYHLFAIHQKLALSNLPPPRAQHHNGNSIANMEDLDFLQ